MATPGIQTRQWQLNVRPRGNPELSGPNSTFKLVNVTLPPLAESQVLIKQFYISNDAAQRVWINVMDAQPRLNPLREDPCGNLCYEHGGGAEYTIQDAEKCLFVPKDSKFNLTHSLGALGLTGTTAYYCLVEIVRTTKEDVVVVNGAAGATGSVAIQVAKKVLGCKKVIGIAGTDEKCRWVERLGADKCINYKSPTFESDLAEATERKVDVFFDNVAGPILDTMFTHMSMYGRIALCGAISRYNTLSDSAKFNHFEETITQRLELRGFVVLDYWNEMPKTIAILTKAAEEGKLELGGESETVVTTRFEDIPET